MCRSLPDTALYSPLNPFSGAIALGLMAFLAWSVACGDHRMLSPMVVVTSFVVQVHFSLVLPALVATATATVGLGIDVRRRRRSAWGRRGWPRFRRSMIAAAVAGLVCWSAPLLDQAFNDPGNLGRILDLTTVDEPRYGVSAGWRAAVNVVNARRWVGQPAWDGPAAVNEVTSTPSPGATASVVLVIVVLAAVGAAGLNRRRTTIVAGAVLALSLAAATVVAASLTPTRLAGLLGLTKALVWASPAGMFIWLVALWAPAALMDRAAVRRLRMRRTLPSPRAWTVAGVGVTSVVAVIASTDGRARGYDWTFTPVRELSSELDGRLPRSETVLVNVQLPYGLDSLTFHSAMVYQLRRNGQRVVTADALRLDKKFGPSYDARRHPPSRTLDITQGVMPPRHAERRVLARVPVPATPSGTPAGKIVATIAPSASGR
jgi:hypothetical protein